MLELLFCALFTILPDYLYRRYVQGKRVGREITLFTVWYELRWGITACLLLTVSLLTTVFYFHPSTHSAVALYRTVSILPETSGRVAEVFVKLDDEVATGAPLFRLDSSEQEAALNTALRRIDEIDAEMAVARTEIAAAEGAIQQAQGSLNLALDELATKSELQRRQSGTVAVREIERLQRSVDGLQGAVAATVANRATVDARLTSLLPAQKASAEAALRQAQTEMDKTTVYSSIDGKVQQFVLRPGEVVNPMLRPAGILVPSRDQMALQAGFNQIEADVLKVGMLGEVTCAAKPFTIIPVVVAVVQNVIAAGQIRGTDQLVDVQDAAKSGTITIHLLPLYTGGFDGIPLGSNCIANAYTSNHERLANEELSTPTFLFLHAVDAVAMVHAIILRLQALLLPVTTLVLGGH